MFIELPKEMFGGKSINFPIRFFFFLLKYPSADFVCVCVLPKEKNPFLALWSE